ncbi:c-type cytochrome [Planctomyces sp. SH-PL62]|uniref:c-type cytochrome n=1 Tax=Planctomyces sp. SH-PL62 TaxID=1636152 RepID=UPI00078C7827|nr:c-type cytochrome [Planctomyces sp. SH-PL62]AMV37277.1 Cytochrome c [Planctomyces sp. SH-PL62]
MPSADETYRSQPTLHRIFAVTSVGLLAAVVWMIAADHDRPWKRVQRDFQRLESSKLKALEAEKLAGRTDERKAEIEQVRAKLREAEEESRRRASELVAADDELKRLGGKAERSSQARRFKQAELDSLRTVYDGMIERGESRRARDFLDAEVAEAERRLADLAREDQEAQAALATAQAAREALGGNIESLKLEQARLTREVDRIRRVIEQKEARNFGVQAWLRGLPGVDMAASPTKIEQITLPQLTIDYNFKDVPRQDRCTTCHQGIDRPGYDLDAEGRPTPPVFASHPSLDHGATAVDGRGKPVKAGLFLDPNGPHPIHEFGCTICHGGQGSGVDFANAAHTPDDPAEAARWRKDHGWAHAEHWDFPMLPSRFAESSCLKCHQDVTDVPEASRLQAGRRRIASYGCFGCHEIGGGESPGPNFADESRVGPSLRKLASKVSPDWLFRWIKDPHAFRPDTRMPRYYGLSEDLPGDAAKADAEVHGMVRYLLAKSESAVETPTPAEEPDPDRGKETFLQKGCLACHQHRPYRTEGPDNEVALRDRKAVDPTYKPDVDQTFDPSIFPESARSHAMAELGPNLVNVAAKFPSDEQGQAWLASWLIDPGAHDPESLMPDLQLSVQEAADVAAWLQSVPGGWPAKVEAPPADAPPVRDAVDELVRLYVKKGGYLKDGKAVGVPLGEVESFVAGLPADDKLLFLGEKTIGRLGCFGCHDVPGFEDAKPIGVALSDWGSKSLAQLDFGHVDDFLQDHRADALGRRDGVDPFYQDQIAERSRVGFLFQKLHRPRSYDHLKRDPLYKAWDDRLRMPQFAWADDPEAVEEVMTFVLGLTGERVHPRYVARTHYDEAQIARAEGVKILDRYQCAGCHVMEMPRYRIAAGTAVADALPAFRTNLRASYNARASDFSPDLLVATTHDPALKLDDESIEASLAVGPDDGSAVEVEAMPVDELDDEISVQVWKPVVIRGYTFNVGDILTFDRTRIQVEPARGGGFAWLYAAYQAEETGKPFDSFWNRLPPPLIREGLKVQTSWTSLYLKDPYAIRPAAQLRMPRYHYRSVGRETEQLANYFAAVDGVEFPYQTILHQLQGYVVEREKVHPNYLDAGYAMMAAKGSPCIQCHAVGPYKPDESAVDVVHGPELRQVANRFRPEYLRHWIANPRRLVPYTGMPQNLAPTGPAQMPPPPTFENQPLEMIRAMRDALLNYANVVERRLVETAPADPPAPEPAAAAPPLPKADAPAAEPEEASP